MTAVDAVQNHLALEVDGMHCEACVRRVTQALTRADQGAVKAVSIGKATLAAPPEAAPALLAALEKAGFAARLRPQASE